MKTLVLSAYLLFCTASFAQHATPAQTPQPPSYANYSIMLMSPVSGAGAVVLMHNAKNGLEFVDATKIQAALTSGYVPVRAAEITESIGYLRAEIERLTAENARLQGQQPRQASAPGPSLLSPEEQDARRRAQAASEQVTRRQQLIQAFLMMQNANRPQPYQLPMPVNPNANRLQTNCTTSTIGNVATTNCN
jgi:hypothetical protein